VLSTVANSEADVINGSMPIGDVSETGRIPR
jgi:hypothetical protein